jgi:nucleotide-binding universal stress UspA family protein
MFAKILVALDNSEMSQIIFDQAVFLAKAIKAEITLLHILSPLEDPYINPIFLQADALYPAANTEAMNAYMKVWDEMKETRLNWLKSLTQEAVNLGINAQYIQSVGDAGRIICETSRNLPADLIIIGRRGRTGFSELFLGSVSNYVLHHAPCSVLTVQGVISQSQDLPIASA